MSALPHEPEPERSAPPAAAPTDADADQHCPVCGAALIHEKCKVICRSPTCIYRIVFNCAEF
ncbi:MAG: hypothetical protein WDO13_11850 [Verrucomicrobiota bacterium]